MSIHVRVWATLHGERPSIHGPESCQWRELEGKERSIALSRSQEQKDHCSHVICLFFEVEGGALTEFTNGVEFSVHETFWEFHGASL